MICGAMRAAASRRLAAANVLARSVRDARNFAPSDGDDGDDGGGP